MGWGMPLASAPRLLLLLLVVSCALGNKGERVEAPGLPKKRAGLGVWVCGCVAGKLFERPPCLSHLVKAGAQLFSCLLIHPIHSPGMLRAGGEIGLGAKRGAVRLPGASRGFYAFALLLRWIFAPASFCSARSLSPLSCFVSSDCTPTHLYISCLSLPYVHFPPVIYHTPSNSQVSFCILVS